MLIGKRWLARGALKATRTRESFAAVQKRFGRPSVGSSASSEGRGGLVALSYSSSAYQHENSARIISSLTNPYGEKKQFLSVPSVQATGREQLFLEDYSALQMSYPELHHDNAVKHCGKLRTNTKYRQEERSALLAGLVPILELKRECTALNIKTLLWSGSKNSIPAGQILLRLCAQQNKCVLESSERAEAQRMKLRVNLTCRAQGGDILAGYR